MAVWRRRALALFPEWKSEFHEIADSPYSLFWTIRAQTYEAHRSGDRDFLRRAYGFAEYCSNSTAKQLWNSAGVSFYEHIVEERDLWDSVALWICPDVKKDVEALWELSLASEELDEFQSLYAIQKGRRARETVYHTRQIFEL